MPAPFVINTTNSPYSKLLPVTISEVSFTDGLLAERLRTIKEITIPTQYELLEQTQRLFNFRRAAGKTQGDYFGFLFIGKIAIKRGPIVYCIEQVDNNFPICDLEIDPEKELIPVYSEILKGVITIKGRGYIPKKDLWKKNLYLSEKEFKSKRVEVEFTLIPYYAWANREQGPMQVWIRKT